MQNKTPLLIIIVVFVVISSMWLYVTRQKSKNSESVVTPPVVFVPHDTTLRTKYIHLTQDATWPPVVTLSVEQFTCIETGTEISTNGKTVQKSIAGKTYCVSIASEGAAGSTYTTYTYTTMANGKLAKVSFTLRATQCMNYDNPQQTECLAERAAFDPDNLANMIVENAVKK